MALDGKGRLGIPTRYRDTLVRECEGRLVVTVDSDPCLLLYPLPEWEELERKLTRLPSLNPQVRRLQRLLIGHATECEMDSSGRILLSPPLREFAHLDRAVALIGQGHKFEIWDESQWQVRRAEWLSAAGTAGTLATELESLSL